MFLIDNLRIHCLECDYAVDSSSSLADLQWISFVFEIALWNIFICSVKCASLYVIIINISPFNTLSIKPQTAPK